LITQFRGWCARAAGDVAGLLDAREQLFLARVELQRPGALAPGIPEHLGADVVEARHRGQVPARALRPLASPARVLLMPLIDAALGQRMHLPYAARHHGLLRAGPAGCSMVNVGAFSIRIAAV
jgi:hypothetical protein